MELLQRRELRFQLFDFVLGRSHLLLGVHSDARAALLAPCARVGQPFVLLAGETQQLRLGGTDLPSRGGAIGRGRGGVTGPPAAVRAMPRGYSFISALSQKLV